MNKRRKILIVDDSEINRELLKDMLSGDYDIMEAPDGLKAVSILNRYHAEISLVLLDIVMPKMDGFGVLAAMNHNGWIRSVPVITISAETSNDYIEHAYELGVAEYISRPFDFSIVRHRVRNTIMLYDKQKYLEKLVTQQLLEKEKSNLIMVDVLSHIVEFRNGESGLHVLHIRVMTETLLKRLKRRGSRYALTSEQLALIINASALHDIGKISIPEQILNKPGKLTQQEYEIMKQHSLIGAQILENTPYHQSEELLRIAGDICRWHHERYDGGGYPDGLAGEEIPISAQVVALADVYDALTNRRVYKPAYSHETAMRMILNGECGVFNPVLLECLQEAAPYLEKEMKERSQQGSLDSGVRKLSRSLIRNETSFGRTLALLEQERTKYQFFASMSREIQFEYICGSDLLNVSEWGAALLGIGETIVHPSEDQGLAEVFSREDYLELSGSLRDATPDNPVVSHTYCLNVRGEKRWYRVVLRPLWIEGAEGEMTGVIGKFIDLPRERRADRAETDGLAEDGGRDL